MDATNLNIVCTLPFILYSPIHLIMGIFIFYLFILINSPTALIKTSDALFLLC